jgi:hypothetical protein
MPLSDGSWDCSRCETNNDDQSEVCSNCSTRSVDPNEPASPGPGLTPDNGSLASSPAVSHMSYSDDDEDMDDDDDDMASDGEQEQETEEVGGTVGTPDIVGSDVDDDAGGDDNHD